jgi:hypothetical protein
MLPLDWAGAATCKTNNKIGSKKSFLITNLKMLFWLFKNYEKEFSISLPNY